MPGEGARPHPALLQSPVPGQGTGDYPRKARCSVQPQWHFPDPGQHERSPWPALLLRWFHAIQRKSRIFGPGKENRSTYNKYL
ncbi:hypothetical protein DV515_00010752 [Chloebia gouldiae]|uniref:Uncharacterized protein n=1 Tax=Chloebia gouldiae TaxID=44316 RepID=A0A3L8S867_CHLGU|nr:hypothetical protein DV515_00010752 [Chloebia gouldiae]